MMQALSVNLGFPPYAALMTRGRPSTRLRPPFGQRMAAARERLGLSQSELAERLDTSQKVIAYWERNPVALRPDQLTSLASALQLTPEELLGDPTPRPRNGGPVGKARRLFEAVSALPRHQQQRILGVVEDMLAAHRDKSTA